MDIAGLQKEMEDAKAQSEKHKGLAAAYDERAASLDEMIRGATRKEKADAIIESALAELPLAPVKAEGYSRDRYRKSKTQIYEDIVREHGMPMHLTAILNAALDRGITFKGNDNRKPLKERLRGALLSAVRLENMGSNYWWIVDAPLADEAHTSQANETGNNDDTGRRIA